VPNIFHVDRNKSVNFHAHRGAKNQQRCCFDRQHPETGDWERMGQEFYYNNSKGSFASISDPTDWKLTIQSDGGGDNWRESKVRTKDHGNDSVYYESDDTSKDDNAEDLDYDDLIVEVSLYQE
jgi:hypothetical protein